MKFIEYGDKSLPAIVLLHGGGLSCWSLQGVVSALESDYHVVTPIIDGHGDDSDETFISIEDSSNKLIRYIDSTFDGKVFGLGGLSLGAQIVAEVLSKRPEICRYALIESALVYPMKSIAALTVPTYKLCYGLIKKRWFSKLQSKSLFVPDALFEHYYKDSIQMSKQTLINITLSNGNYALKNSISLTQAKVIIIAGEKELGIMKKSARALNQAIKGSRLIIAPNMKHGELSLVYPLEYVKILKTLMV